MCKSLWKTKKNNITEATLTIVNRICDVDELKCLINSVSYYFLNYYVLEIIV